MKYLLFAGLLLAAGQVHAQQVYKCVKGKDVSYQSQPCAGAQKQAKAWDAPPDPMPTYRERAIAEQKRRQGEAESAYLRQLAGTDSLASSHSGRGSGASIPSQSSRKQFACESAKRRRKAALDAAGLDRTHDMLRNLDEMVYQACK